MGAAARPLEGVKVLELATFVAAPCCCRYLADLGAEVIKVESFQGDSLRYTALNEGRPVGELENTTYDQENAGKKCISLNTKTAEGREILEKLIGRTDVFVTNWRQAALERAGLDYESLKGKYPKLIYGLVSGYGEKGPDKDLPGYDFTAFFGRGGILGTMYDKDSMPMSLIAGFGDHQVGMYLASGIIAALYRAKSTGDGDKVTVSLLHTAAWDVSIMLTSAQYGDVSTQFPISRKRLANQLQVAHKTSDGRWIQIAMPQYNFYYPKFIALIGREDLVEDERFFPQTQLTDERLEELYEVIKEAIAKRPLAQWVQLLTEADIPFAVAQTWNELLEDPQAWASDCFYKMDYPTGATRTLVRSPVLFEESGLPPYVRAPYLGEQTGEILADLGYTSDQITQLVGNGVAKAHD